MPWIQGSVIVILALLIFWPALGGDWIGDGELYITSNPLMYEPGRLWKAWFVPGSFIEYYPIQETVQWIQWQLFGKATFGYQLTNVILHIVGAFLVWRLLNKLGLRWGWLGGLLFVVHPMNTDSVVDIAELKNTLSLPPFLLALCFYMDFEETKRPRDYFLALAFFLVAMLCKISMAPFPFVMLLYAWWKRGRLCSGDLRNALPFLAISVALSILTAWSGVRYTELYPSHPAIVPTGDLLSRLPLIGQTISYYFVLFFWPIHPLPIYPRWSIAPLTPLHFLPLLAEAATIWVLWQKRQSWGRHALLGLGFFAIMLLPFSGLIVISYMQYTWVLDHLLYIPMIGLIGLAIAALEQIGLQLPKFARPIQIAAIAVAMLFLAVQSQDYAAEWSDSGTLSAYIVTHNPDAWLARYNLGNYLRLHQHFEEAAEQYEKAIALNPTYDWAYNNLGMTLIHFPERQAEAISKYEEALRLRSHFPEAHNNLANALVHLPGRVPDAIAEYQAALRDRPDFIEARYNLGLALLKTPGRTSEAREQFEEVLRRDPDFGPAQDMMEKLNASPSNH